MAKKLDWDRVRRERALGAHERTRGRSSTCEAALPASDKQVDQLVTLGYSGKRPVTSAEARVLIRELRDAKKATGHPDNNRWRREPWRSGPRLRDAVRRRH